jgi:hypothetical protein
VNRSRALLALLSAALSGQTFTQRGLFETSGFLYPQTAPNDSGQYVGEAFLRWEASVKFSNSLRINGSIDARTDTHRQFQRAWGLDVLDQDIQRPAFSLRRFSLTYNKGGLTLEAGRQFVRWGKADILNPTDRFAPRDFTNVVHPDYLGIVAIRATYEAGGNTIDAVYSPLFTPSRGPLLNQRWVVLPAEAQQIPINDLGSHIPGRGQYGLRVNHTGRGYELSGSYYDGFYSPPFFNLALNASPALSINLQRYFPRLRLYGGDVAVPLRWFTLKGEAAYFQSPDNTSDQFALYVIQAERIAGEWTFVGGYAGEAVTSRRLELNFNPERGIARTFLGRASYNLDANRTVSFEGAIRQNADGGYAKAEYTQAIGNHWRATASFNLLRGQPTDFFGQYRRNSHFLLTLRYSF